MPGEVFAKILLQRIRPHMLKRQHSKPSGFTPKKSTIEHILAMRVISERMHEYQRKFLVAYVDLCKAFESVNPDSLYHLFHFRGIQDTLISLLSALYTGAESTVRCGRCLSEVFPIYTGVGQGSSNPF